MMQTSSDKRQVKKHNSVQCWFNSDQ